MAEPLSGIKNYIPTLEEIREVCEEIQAEWSEHERSQRTVMKPRQDLIPQGRDRSRRRMFR